MVSRRPLPAPGSVFAAATSRGTAAQSPRVRAFRATWAILALLTGLHGWPKGQPASVRKPPTVGVRSRAGPLGHEPACFELERPAALPAERATHRWREHPCRPPRRAARHHRLSTWTRHRNQPEWALLEAGASQPNLHSLGQRRRGGDTILGPLRPDPGRGGIDGADRGCPRTRRASCTATTEHLSRADSPSGLLAGDPEPAEPALAAGQAQPAEEPVSTSTPEVAARKPQVPAAEQPRPPKAAAGRRRCP